MQYVDYSTSQWVCQKGARDVGSQKVSGEATEPGCDVGLFLESLQACALVQCLNSSGVTHK